MVDFVIKKSNEKISFVCMCIVSLSLTFKFVFHIHLKQYQKWNQVLLHVIYFFDSHVI